MEYRVLVVKNRFTDYLDFTAYLDWYKKNTPLEIKMSELVTDFDLTFEHSSNATFSGVTVDETVKEQLRKLIPRYAYHEVMFYYGNDAPGIRVSCTDQLPLYKETEFIEVVNYKDKGKTANHESVHAKFGALRHRFNIFLNDPMDSCIVNGVVMPYYNDADMDSPNSNRGIALQLLKPYWAMLSSMQQEVVQTPQPTPAPIRTLKIGIKGEDVKQLQNDLNTFIGAKLIADGDFGKKTRLAVIKFQKLYGLIADGIAGARTLQKLADLKKK